MPSPLVWSYGLMAAASGALAGLLIIGAVRNHFIFHRVRPAILALAYLFSTLSVHGGIRVYSANLRETGQMDAYMRLLESAWWSGITYATTLGVVLVGLTLIFAYPDLRRK